MRSTAIGGFVLFVSLSVLGACEKGTEPESHAAAPPAGSPEQASAPQGVMLLFVVDEAGVDPYQARMIITGDFMRVDDAPGPNDFVLFDRREKTIYSVASDTQSILVINHRDVVEEPPLDMQLSEDKVEHGDAPEIGGRQAVLYRFRVNDAPCYNAFAVEGLLPGAVEALREYRYVLAGQHAAAMGRMPAELHDACDLSTHIFSPVRHLSHGMPVQEWDETGYRRTLVDYDDQFQVEPGLFELPEGFTKSSMNL